MGGLWLKQEYPGRGTSLFGWFYNAYELKNYRNEQSEVPLSSRIVLHMQTNMPSGHYLVRWFDTMSGDCISSSLIDWTKGGELWLKAPEIRLDLAFKMIRIGEGK